MGSRFAPFSNWAARSPIGKLVSSAMLGVHPERTLPEFAGETLPKWFRRRRGASMREMPVSSGDRATTKGTVALFNDTFMSYNYPEVGIAATELLEAAGFNVALADPGCCGRPMLSKGMMDDAVAAARYNVDLLHAYADQGFPLSDASPAAC